MVEKQHGNFAIPIFISFLFSVYSISMRRRQSTVAEKSAIHTFFIAYTLHCIFSIKDEGWRM